jgi:hypothetical protein
LASSWWGFLEGLRGVIPRDLRRALEPNAICLSNWKRGVS